MKEDSSYTIRLNGFEGPLDLLLHLIRKNEIDIFNIPIALITEQYMEYLRIMKTLNLDIAGEYLLMASTLLHIKSRMLLPRREEEEEKGQEEDPRAELVQRLLEYQKYKAAAEELTLRPMLYRDVFIRLIPPDTENEEEQEERIEVTLFDLLEAFRQMMKRAKEEPTHEIALERITVEERIQEILSLLKEEKKSIAFHLLFPEGASKRMIIVTFLAILELVKMKWIRIFQVAPFEPIRITPI